MLGYSDLENEIVYLLSFENKKKDKEEVDRCRKKQKKRARSPSGIREDLEMGEGKEYRWRRHPLSQFDSRRCI